VWAAPEEGGKGEKGRGQLSGCVATVKKNKKGTGGVWGKAETRQIILTVKKAKASVRDQRGSGGKEW
jgi:hypothetical protein